MLPPPPTSTEVTTLHRPHLGWGLALGIVFIVAGLLILPATSEMTLEQAPKAAQKPPVIVWAMRFGLPFGFVGLGSLAAFAALREMLRDRTIRSTPNESLPDVSTEPVNDTRRIAHSRVTHRIENAGQGWSLTPLGRLITRTQRVGIAWCLGTWVVVNTILWMSGPERMFATAMTIVSVPAALGVIAIVWWMMDEARTALRRLDVDELARTFRLDGKEPRQLAEILAVQLCALRIKVGPAPAIGRRYACDSHAIELNLVLRDGKSLERQTLLVNDGDFIGTAQLARQLAGRLAVPLLNHATAAHWRAEKERASDRPWTHQGSVP